MSIVMMVPYDRRLEPIDEQLAKLIGERYHLSNGRNGYPTKEQIDRWSQEYVIDRNIIVSVFASMNDFRRAQQHSRRSPTPSQHHRRDAKVTMDDITYQITRMEQYSDFSLIYVDIFTRDDAQTADLNIQLRLHVEPAEERHIQVHRAQSQVNQVSLVYMVSPRLSDDVGSYKFALIPHPVPRYPRPIEVVLDQQVVFDSSAH